MKRVRGIGAGIVIGLTMAVVAGGALVWSGGLSVPNPFRSELKERDQSALLVQLRDVSRFEAADGQFQVLVDQEHDARLLPSWLAGDRTTMIAEGDVTAVVDFSELGRGSITTSADGTSATVALPRPTLSRPRIDPDHTRVLTQKKGLVDRLDEALSGENRHDQELYQAADRKLARAAASSDLLERAKANTTKMLTGMLEGLGYEHVHVTYGAAPGAEAA